MLEAVVGTVVSLLVVAGILVMIGPNLRGVLRRAKSLQPPARLKSPFPSAKQREAAPAGLSPKTQRVLVGAARLTSWLRTNGHDDLARDLRGAAAKMAGDEAAGLYAMQALLRKVRAVATADNESHDRLRALSTELRAAVQDRFEQLELLPFGRP
jgi:hypothetical protein